MRFKVAVLAIIDGLILACSAAAFLLGFIYAATISAEYILLVFAPILAVWLHKRINKLCDRMQRLDGGENE